MTKQLTLRCIELWKEYQYDYARLFTRGQNSGVLFRSFNVRSAVISIVKPSCEFRHDRPIWNALGHTINRSLDTETQYRYAAVITADEFYVTLHY